MLILPQKYQIRNPVWEHYTPNEIYNDLNLSRSYLGYDYCDYEGLFAIKNHYTGKKVWQEYRVIKGKPELEVTHRSCWWNDPMFMDKVFWVYMKPIRIKINNKPMFFFMLEMFETNRVYRALLDKTGAPPFKSEYPGLLIPKDCIENCWTETTGGFADNIRHRPDEVVTQEMTDFEGKVDELVEKIKPVDIKELKASMDNIIERPTGELANKIIS